jgi:hypothetical protein
MPTSVLLNAVLSIRQQYPYVKIKGKAAYLYRAVVRSVLSKWWRHQG